MDSLESIEIENFLCIKHIKWDVKNFNIITGDMGSGKSLCIKLLHFCESILNDWLRLKNEKDFETRVGENFYDKLKSDFKEIFNFNQTKDFTISYIYKEFDLKITGNTPENLNIKSKFLDDFFETLRKESSLKQEAIYQKLLKQFDNEFPLIPIFIPASRAGLSFMSNSQGSLSSRDPHINLFDSGLKRMIEYNYERDSSYDKFFEKILKGKYDPIKKCIISIDGRETPLAKASSGQQEVVYILEILAHLDGLVGEEKKPVTIFIEEPSAHLFPMGQLLTLEKMVEIVTKVMNKHKLTIKLVVTTHSPYVLNVVNNILRKGYLEKRINKDTNQKRRKEFLQKLEADLADLPILNEEDVSAFYIEDNGKMCDMRQISYKGTYYYIYNDKLEEITQKIDDDIFHIRDLESKIPVI